VISSDRFNALTRLPIVVPITTGGGFVRNIGFAVSLAAAGTRITGVVRCDQPRPVDLLARGARKVETVPQEILDEVLARTAAIFA
jgi:mRNA-degrading endonuclease toxin of MazEF toxin-antitoxin module